MPATRPVFVSFHRRSKIIQASSKNIEKAPSDHYVTHIQCIRLQLRFSTIGPLYSWEHELISLSAGSYPDHRRGARRDPLSGTQPQHCTALRGGVSWLANTTEFQTNDSGSRGLKRAGSPGCLCSTRRGVALKCGAKQRPFIGSSPEKIAWSFPLFWNQLAKSAVVCGASVNLEPALKQRQCTRTPANSTAAAPHYAYSCRSSGVCRSWRQRAVNCVCAGLSVRRAVRLTNKAPAMPVLLPPKLAQKSNPLRLLGTQVCADLIRSSQMPPPRQPAWRVIKTRAIISADAVERGSGASQILKDSARYSDNCLQRAGRTCGTASPPLPGPDSSPLQTRRCPPHALFSQVSADQKQNKLRENIQKCCVGQLCNSHPVRPITAANQRIWPTLQLGTRIGFTFSWKLSRPQARGAA
ncbi:Hypothetical_protein [Hexamita inflata]|uniref:Hypothetical_protein n=1 Tax=Hexamita inflata TaxID=28002 RepID=A0AA86UZG2_9EUKA|nr:Hypothetical protein HINF_LOCUS62099 [Hexamita inflata]